MGHQKRREKKNKSKKYTVRGIDQTAVETAALAAATSNSTNSTTSPTIAPACLAKLAAIDAVTREEGCLDVAHFATMPAHLELLVQHGCHRLLVTLLRDVNVNVRCAAAAALRNIFSEGSCDGALAALVSAGESGGGVVEVMLAAIRELFFRHTGLLQQVGSGELPEEDDVMEEDEEGETSNRSGSSQLRAVQRCLQQMLMLGSVMAEACEPVAVAMSGTPAFLLCLVDLLLVPPSPSSLLVEVAVAAGDLLRVVTDESDAAAQFFATMLPVEKQNELNALTSPGMDHHQLPESGIPLSPQLLLLRLHVCGVLLNVAPNASNASRIIPFIAAGLDFLPIREVARAVPFLAEGCEATVELRSAAVDQCQARLRALQASLDLSTQLLAWITSCSAEADEDDEATFAQNPLAPLFLASAIPVKLLALLGNVFAPLDVITAAALRRPSEHSRLTSIQHLVLSAEVGLFSLTATILLLVPVESLGDCANVYRAALTAIRTRQELLSQLAEASTGASPHVRAQLVLQMESLAEICWTVQRKTDNESGGGAAGACPEDLDVFTRLAWLSGVGKETILCLIGNVSLLGRQRHTDSSVLSACARFVLACLSTKSSSSGVEVSDGDDLDQMELEADAANGLIDMFSFDECDQSVYIPLGVHATLSHLLPRFKRLLRLRGEEGKRGPRGCSRSPRAAAVLDHVRTVAANLEAFLRYKRDQNHGVL